MGRARSSVSGVLARRKHALESELADVNEAIRLLGENPQMAQTFDAISRVVGAR